MWNGWLLFSSYFLGLSWGLIYIFSNFLMVFSPSDLYVSFCRNFFLFRRLYGEKEIFITEPFCFLYIFSFVKKKKNINGFILYVKRTRKNRSTNTKKISWASFYGWLYYFVSNKKVNGGRKKIKKNLLTLSSSPSLSHCNEKKINF